MISFFTKVFGTMNDRVLKKYKKELERVLRCTKYNDMGGEELTQAARDVVKKVKGSGCNDALLPDLFNIIRLVAKEELGYGHFNSQLIGGLVLNDGKVAEMVTGEGKTLVATLPAILNSICGHVHIATANNYLAERDCNWMRPIYERFGLSCSFISDKTDDEGKEEAYSANIVYSTISNFGFDYLRNNMVYHESQRVYRAPDFMLVDEADSILIDEARTPLVISGPSTVDDQRIYNMAMDLVRGLPEEAFIVHDEERVSVLTEYGYEVVEEKLESYGLRGSLFSNENMPINHAINKSLQAVHSFIRDVDYIVRAGEVVLIDQLTGRVSEGRRFSDGLHQALEAKEGVDVQPENQTIASISIQNYCQKATKLAGMTGTASTEAEELYDIYKMETVSIPPNAEIIRRNYDDNVFVKKSHKMEAILKEVKKRHSTGQPLLIGTLSIESSTEISEMLARSGLKHEVLNAKNNEREAEIIAMAGAYGAITVATNMAGRGTDIKLGGPDEKDRDRIVDLGGLCVIGAERNESRRIDNQLRGRSGRQGDPGASMFFLSLEDDIMARFGIGDSKISSFLMESAKSDMIQSSSFMSGLIEKTQRRIEGHNYEIRKNLFKYDNIFSIQRDSFYSMRDAVLLSDDVFEIIAEINSEVIGSIYADESSYEGFFEKVKSMYPRLADYKVVDSADDEAIVPSVLRHLDAAIRSDLLDEKYGEVDELMNLFRREMLSIMDMVWVAYLLNMEHLKDGIGLMSYAGKDPQQEYTHRAFDLFMDMKSTLNNNLAAFVSNSKLEVKSPE